MISKIKNIIRWLPVLWNDYDWDHWFIYQILKTKLKHQSRHLKQNYDFVHSQRINLCIRLIEKVQNEEYIDLSQPWTKESMDHSFNKHKKARKLLFKLLEHNIEKWWI